MKLSRLMALASLVCIASIVIAACQSRTSEPEPQRSEADAPPPFAPTATVKDLMLSVIDPAADVVWLSVTTVVSDKGTVETKPITDEDWTKVRHGAITLLEATNLLLVPGRRVARPGEKSEVPGVELEPEEMDVNIAKDRAGWNMRVKALHEAAEATLRAVEAHDADKVFELGEQIENSCEGCHRHFWYPNEKIPELPAAP